MRGSFNFGTSRSDGEHSLQPQLEQLEVVLNQSAGLLQVLSVHEAHERQVEINFLQEQHYLVVDVECGG